MKYVTDILKEWTREVTSEGTGFHYPRPENAREYYFEGFIQKNDCAADFTDWHGFEIRIRSRAGQCAREREINGVLKYRLRAELADRDDIAVECSIPYTKGTISMTVPFSMFPAEEVAKTVWQYVTAVWIEGLGENYEIEELCVCKAAGIYVDIPVRGMSGDDGQELCYKGTVYNCRPVEMSVSIRQSFEGWESLMADIELLLPDGGLLLPYGSADFSVRVKIHDYMVPGGNESTRLLICAQTGENTFMQTAVLKSMRKLPHPYIYHDESGWRQVMKKIESCPMYKPAFENYISTADLWEVVPPIEGRDFCYETKEETNLMCTAYAYALTREEKYAKKLGRFFRFFSDPQNGYPSRLKGCSQSYVQEGHFFQHLAVPYDIICASGVLPQQDRDRVEHCFRLYMDQLDKHLMSGKISNWLVSEILGAVYCALAIQDMERTERFVFGNGGMTEQFRHGIFNDGWWHECSVGYNTWVSSMMIHLSHALLPFGINLTETYFQIPFNQTVSSVYGKSEPAELSGMSNRKWGGNRKNYVCIKDMFDATLPFLDYRGVLFGIADSDEKKLSGVHFGSTYDLAYTYYKAPEYIPVMKRNAPDPVFGHAVLPEYNADGASANAFSDNIGLAMLRSQTKGREQREQIQAVLRYGSHGGAHGHFDIGGLLSVMRYGRSFYNPENCWWGYAHFMYKFYVQCSLTKNMVVVDNKMQIPADSKRILFESGEKLQTAGIEVRTKWAYPPYGGMVYYQDGQVADKESLRRRCEMNVCCLPIQEGEDSPKYGEINGYTEDILQRRVMAVTDDYIVLFDYLEGEQEHTFDSLMQIKGFKGIEGGHVGYSYHTEQMDENPVSDAQFITDCDWYNASGITTAHFETVFTEEDAGEQKRCDRSNYNEPGILKMDVHTSWPPETEQMVGRVAIYDGWAADGDGYTIPLKYRVEGDGKILAQGGFNGWILGRDEILQEISGVQELCFTLSQGHCENEMGEMVKTPQACFWGNITLECRNGERLEAGRLFEREPERFRWENTDPGFGIGKDYKGGRVTIVGKEYPYAVPASPVSHDEEGRLFLLLTGLDVIRLTACVGIDAFPGDEEQKRKTYAVRTRGKKARFITVIEPFEKEASVQKVTAVNQDCVKVYLRDGREQTLHIECMEQGTPVVELTEYNFL